MNKKPIKRSSMGARVSRGVITLTLISIMSIGLFSYYIYRKDTISEHADSARDIAISIAASIEPQKFIESFNAESEDDYWHFIKTQLDTTKTQLDVEYIYILTLYGNDTFKYYAEGIKPGEDPADIGVFNEVEMNPDIFAEEAFTAVKTGKAITTSVYNSEGYGFMISGFVPILDANNKPIGVIGVDINIAHAIDAANRFGLYIGITGIVLSIIFSVLSKRYIKHLLGYSLNRITKGTDLLAEGDLTFKARDSDTNDEIGRLYANFSKVVLNFEMMISDMNSMFKMHAEGEFDAKIEESKYTGAYHDIVKGVNSMTFMYIDNFKELLDVVQSYGKGNFEANIRKYPGKLSMGNLIVDELRSNLIHVNKEIIGLAETALNGNLSVRANNKGFQGDWLKMLLNLNNLMDAVVVPIQEASDVLQEMANGSLSVKMTGLYKGDFSLIKDNMNKTIDELALYIKEIRETLQAVSKNDLRVKINKHFLGDFAAIEEAIQSIITAQDKFFREIRLVAGQLNNSAAQISESGNRLSLGTAEQLRTIQHLTDSIASVNSQTQDNAKYAEEADKISVTSMSNAANGNEEMKHMLSSMEEIKNSSNNIANIIKVIDGIAFQTNLLALNAAVEAARAGEHGKGFAVVAEEVRSLAARSLEAAKQTQELIDDTIHRVNEGAVIAQSTSDALLKIVDNVSSVSTLISKISLSSKEQMDAVTLITNDINQISNVVEDSTKTADENAVSSDELAGQSKSLNKLLGGVRFKE